MHLFYGYSRFVSLVLFGIAIVLLLLYTISPKFKAQLETIKTKHPKPLHVLAWLGIVCCLVFPYWLAQYQLDYRDSFFHLNLMRTFPVGCDMRWFGTNQIGHFVYLLTSGNVLYMQWMAVLLLQLSIFLPVASIKSVEKSPIGLHDMFIMALFSALFLNYSWLIFSFDTLNLFGLSVVLSLLIRYIYKPSIVRLCLLAMMTGYLITLKFPSVVIVGLIPFVLIAHGIKTKKIGLSILYATSYVMVSLLTFYLLALLQFGSTGEIVQKMSETMAGDEAHPGAMTLLTGYIIKSLDLLVYVSVLLVAYIAIEYGAVKSKWVQFLVPACMFVFCYCMFYTHIEYDYDNARLVFNALTFCLCIYYAVRGQYVLSLAVLACYVMPIVGSNTGIVKLGGAICLLPLAYLFMREHKNRKYIYICLVCLIAYAPIRYYCYTFFDDGVKSLTERYTESPKIAGIYSSPKRIAKVTEVQNRIHEIQGSGKVLLCTGIHRHLFTYINDMNDAFHVADLYLDDPKYIAQVVEWANTQTDPYIMVFRYGSLEELTPLEIELQKENVPFETVILDHRGQ